MRILESPVRPAGYIWSVSGPLRQLWDNGVCGICLSPSPTAEMRRHVTFSEHADPFKRDSGNNFQFMCCLKWEGADAHGRNNPRCHFKFPTCQMCLSVATVYVA